MRIILVIAILFCVLNKLYAQNLISNSSFSKVKTEVKTERHRILPGNQSFLKDWYLPVYLNYKKYHEEGTLLYSSVYNYNIVDTPLIRSRAFNYLIFKVDTINTGFISFYSTTRDPISVFQQKLKPKIKKGQYCLKFRYKYLWDKSEHYFNNNTIEFAFSASNLSEYSKVDFTVPEKYIKLRFRDTIYKSDINTPWLNHCALINLEGNERYLTIGGLSNKISDKYKWGLFFIDDIELYFNDGGKPCTCEKPNLVKKNTSVLPINTEIVSDSLILFRPLNTLENELFSHKNIIYLDNLIGFLQGKPELKIELIEYDTFNDSSARPHSLWLIQRYLEFFNISKFRISTRSAKCEGLGDLFCRPEAEFVRIGYILKND